MKLYPRLFSIIFALVVVAGTPSVMAAPSGGVAAAPSPGMGRVWFLRPESATIGAYGASPMIYADGAPIGTLPVNSAFDRDFPAGAHQFTVERYGIPTDKPVAAQLAPGSETYLEVQWLPTWEEGYPGKTKSFFILPISAQIAQAWLPNLTYLGQR